MPIRIFQRRRVSALPIAPPVMPRTAGAVARYVAPLAPTDMVGRAIFLFRSQQAPALPVVAGGRLLGWVSEARLLDLLAAQPDLVDRMPVAEAMETPPAVIEPTAPLAEAAVFFQEYGEALLPLAGFDSSYLGCLARTDVLATLANRPAPPRIGGMATPLGVYLYSTTARGGADWRGLFLTGVVMQAMLWVTQNFLLLAPALLYRLTNYYPIGLFASLFSNTALHRFQNPISPYADFALVTLALLCNIAGFLLLLRWTPLLAGYHAAEHQTVNAIEAGEPLTPEAVSRMPRVHPRCGTNLISLLGLTYLGVAAVVTVTARLGMESIPLAVSCALVITLFVAAAWRPVGGWLQQHITTRPANAKEIASGIKAGTELLQRHADAPALPMSLPRRFWRMGLQMVVLGSIISGYLLLLLQGYLDGITQYLLK